MSALGVISLTTITSASAQTYKTGESGKTTIDITAKKGSASTKTRHKPMDLMMLIDNSGSTLFKDSDAMQRMTFATSLFILQWNTDGVIYCSISSSSSYMRSSKS